MSKTNNFTEKTEFPEIKQAADQYVKNHKDEEVRRMYGHHYRSFVAGAEWHRQRKWDTLTEKDMGEKLTQWDKPSQIITAEEFFRNKLRELSPGRAVITLSQEMITAEQAMRWAHEYAEQKKQALTPRKITVVSEDEVNKAFEGTDFGDSKPMDILYKTISDYSIGDASGEISTQICISLGLLSDFVPGGHQSKVTEKGRKFLIEWWQSPPSLEWKPIEKEHESDGEVLAVNIETGDYGVGYIEGEFIINGTSGLIACTSPTHYINIKDIVALFNPTKQ